MFIETINLNYHSKQGDTQQMLSAWMRLNQIQMLHAAKVASLNN